MLRALWENYYNYGNLEEMQAHYADRKQFYDNQKKNYEEKVA